MSDGAKALRALAPNRIVVEFPNDHDIGGAKVEVLDVTPEQIAVALFHLNQNATLLYMVRQRQLAQGAEEIDEMRARLARRES